MSEIFKYADVETTFNAMLRKYAPLYKQLSLRQIRDKWHQDVVAILAAYRVHCASNTSTAQLVLPEPLKTLPLYVIAVLKLPVFSMYKVVPDERVYYCSML
mmetsp:Transcript_19882/g.9252  ORF Transcript_19882/g.9252 Transcript_19882/m.9252 type:complete len:101 (-) Transcript_19882:564-866(-)